MKQFKRIYIEITNICNLSCTFCPKTKRSLSFMNLSTFKSILESVSGYTKEIYLHVMGEPLLHQDISSFITLASQYSINVKITTNGSLIKDKGSLLLNHDNLKQINFSLHSYTANDNMLCFKEYIDNIFDFITLSKNQKYMISLRLWNLKNNYEENNQYIIKRLEEYFGYSYQDDDFKKTRGIKLSSNVWLNQDHQFTWPIDGKETNQKRSYCHGGSDHIAIHVDGSIVLCCLDNEGNIKLGNILESSLEDILNTKEYQSYVLGFKDNKAIHPLCKQCSYKNKF